MMNGVSSAFWRAVVKHRANTHSTKLMLLSLLALCSTPVLAQVNNGSFEDGLNGWVQGGTDRSDSLTAADLDNQITPSDGNRVAFLSTGPGNRNQISNQDRDGRVGNERDVSTLSTTLDFNFFPAVVKYQWSFPSSEQTEDPPFDDIFQVTVDGVSIHTGSANKGFEGDSSFPNAPLSEGRRFAVGGGGNTVGTDLQNGISEFNDFCATIPTARPGDNRMVLEFAVGDQQDNQFDSGLVIDNVEIDTNCGTPGTINVRQMTFTTDGQVEAKDGTIIARFAQNSAPAMSVDARRMAFIANVDYGGTNPSLLQQVYMMEGGAIDRLTSFTGNEVHSVDISAGGRYVVASARRTPEDNLEIVRFDLNNPGTVLEITDTEGCDNTQPTINNNGRRISFLTTCGDDLRAGFNPDANREVVQWNNGPFVLNETQDCQNFGPAIEATNRGRIVTFASSCNYAGNNDDGSLEIFRFDRNGNRFQQITDTDASSMVLDPVDISRDGRYISYIAQDSGGNFVVFRYDNNSGDSTFMGISRPDRLIINARFMVDDGADNENNIFFEALDLLNFSSIIGHIDAPTQLVTESVATGGLSGVSAAALGGVPHVFFTANSNLGGTNSDGNQELFEGIVERQP